MWSLPDFQRRQNLRGSFVSALALMVLLLSVHLANAQQLNLPPRNPTAPGGRQFAREIANLSLEEREQQILKQLAAGNIPNFLRHLCPVDVTNVVAQSTNRATFFVTADYLSIGSAEDYFRVPVSPACAQAVVNLLNCSLPTTKMVDEIYHSATVKLSPSPIPPGPAMTTVSVFSNHNETVTDQLARYIRTYRLGALVAGHKKDLVNTPRLTNSVSKVGIYGWHQTNGQPIQQLYLGHSSSWVDYSQCTRLIANTVLVNGQPHLLAEILADKSFSSLFSDEGPITQPTYSTNYPNRDGQVIGFLGFEKIDRFPERTADFTISPEVKVHLNLPDLKDDSRAQTLILYSLPNGNTIAQTIGKTIKPGDDCHFDIQHIGAQMRFLRHAMPERSLAIAYLEASQKSWPAWRKAHGDKLIPEILTRVLDLCGNKPTEVILSGHSGGGSFIFGFLNCFDAIPANIVRIVFLDSNYAYDSALRHDAKLAQWLKSDTKHSLCVLAYDDANALLDGKPFVSASGGTWGRSHAMQKDLAQFLSFTTDTHDGFERSTALDGRVQFILKQNPDRKVLHTVQVERNGFIHSCLIGTPLENRGYEYFGPRAYSEFVDHEP